MTCVLHKPTSEHGNIVLPVKQFGWKTTITSRNFGRASERRRACAAANRHF
jgi:hypothetical protein